MRRLFQLGISTLALLSIVACAERRLTVAQLTDREQQAVRPAVPVPQPRDIKLTDYHPYRVRVGDILTVTLVGLSEERYTPTTLELRVHGDGRVFPPVVNPLPAAGLELSEVEVALHDAYVPDVVKNLAVYVQLLTPESTTVLVEGPASTPGLVKLHENERNVLYAMTAAGGFGLASSGRVRLKPINPERNEEVYDLTDVNDVRRALLAEPLEAGDVIVVEASDENAVYVTGLVNRAGPIIIPPASRLSVLRAVAAAGGLRDYLDVKEAILIREMPDGDQVQVKLDLGGMIAGRTPDLALKAGDVLSIPYNLDVFAQEWFFKNMIPGPFNVGLHYDPLAQYNAERALRTTFSTTGLRQSIRANLGSQVPALLIPPVPTTVP
jgi:protein involved in polysaccharide export with SLBB domain